MLCVSTGPRQTCFSASEVPCVLKWLSRNFLLSEVSIHANCSDLSFLQDSGCRYNAQYRFSTCLQQWCKTSCTFLLPVFPFLFKKSSSNCPTEFLHLLSIFGFLRMRARNRARKYVWYPGYFFIRQRKENGNKPRLNFSARVLPLEILSTCRNLNIWPLKPWRGRSSMRS